MLTNEDKEKFQKDGYLVIPGFLSETETVILKEACRKIIAEMGPDEQQQSHVFATNSLQRDDYFLNSGDKVRFFFEKNAVNKDGSLKYDKQASLNKIGHALHWLDPDFKRVTFSTKVKELLRSLEMIDPVIIHSMYIFKPPHIGGEVVPHRDASYLYCDPPEKVVGLWIALEDALTDNGCLWFVPGSHTENLEERCIRHTNGDSIQLTPVLPIKCDSQKYVAEPVKKGDLILIHGMVIHKSEQNTSDRPRPIYTFHVMDKSGANFAKDNWIQPTENSPFTPIYTTDSN